MGLWNSFKSKVKAALASLGMLTGVDVTHLMQNFKMDERLANEIMESIYVGRGKGGKKQAHRPSGAAAIKREQLRKLVTVNVIRRLNNHEQSL